MTPRHWAMILLTAACFGSSFFFIKIAVGDIPPLAIAAGRAGIAALVVGAVAWARGARPPPRRDWPALAAIATLTAIVPYSAIAFGQTRIDSALGGILFATIPLFTVLVAPLFLPEEPFTRKRLAGAAIGLAGVAAILGPQAISGLQGQMLGAAATLLAAASYAAGGILARRSARLSPMVMAAGQLAIAAPVLIALSLTLEKPGNLPAPAALAALIAVALISTALPVLLFFRLLREIGAARASVMTFFMPVFAVLLGTLLLNESPGRTAFAGLVLIFAGAVLIVGTPARTLVARESRTTS